MRSLVFMNFYVRLNRKIKNPLELIKTNSIPYILYEQSLQ